MSKAKNTTEILKRLRACFSNVELVDQPIDGYIVPYQDHHQSEYLAPCDKRIEYVCGFTGSAGLAIVLKSKAAFWTDGRYHLQASSQLDKNWTVMKDGLPGVPKPEDWLPKALKGGNGKVGIDPFLFSKKQYEKFDKALTSEGHELVAIAKNLIDVVWKDQPPRPANKIIPLKFNYTGMKWEDKIKLIRSDLKKEKAKALVVTALDEIAWLFNLRGSDIDYNPVFFSYAVVGLTFVNLFLRDEQRSKEVRDHLNASSGIDVTLLPYSTEEFVKSLEGLKGPEKIWASLKESQGTHMLIDNAVTKDSPIQLPKAIKNQAEITGMRNAHIRDAVALCEYLLWLENEVPKGSVDEISGATYLDTLRSKQDDFVSLSFPTISSVGPNGAIIHYFPTEATKRSLTTEEIYLVDSGGQYLDGTTDVTRTVHFGDPTPFQKECYTRVLKGHINLACVVFPNRTKGHQLDVLARQALWKVGLDYLHGTGHGVGSFLNVHEGPQSVSSRATDDAPMEEGMIISDEPGYYEDGSFGIRIESLLVTVKASTENRYKNVQYLTFEPITLVPLMKKMIDVKLLTSDEIEWVNAYHSQCRDIIGKELEKQNKKDVLEWLNRETTPISV
ncbi:xaa-Pro aminopeptidase 1-like [Oscarella lobularis]|uniref:xaa-Pro aminopeptidase 1-like n=1 Tax=Oscarella lobularis TaxID=121494 RepID=UPI0033132098